jgi:hypothetical protein
VHLFFVCFLLLDAAGSGVGRLRAAINDIKTKDKFCHRPNIKVHVAGLELGVL